MSRKRLYRSDLFNLEKLTSTDALESALEELQSILTKDNFKHVFQELIDNESPHTLLLVLSSLSETTSLISWFLESFPAEAADYDATVHCKTISCLFTQLLSSPIVEDKEPCSRHHEMAQITPEVLKYLLSFLRPVDIGSEHHNKKGKVEQRMLRPFKREDGARTLVKKYFDVDMPETSSEASALVDHVLQSQKETLKFYLELLCHPGVSISLKEDCITFVFSIEDEKNALRSAVEPFVYPIVQPMNSALYFDTAEGFGEWIVVVSSGTDKFLRSTHKKDISTFNVTVKKIKELSCGHFTDNNQKRLSGRATEVPVFEAKVSRNLRLVYQIDIIPEDYSEHQAIKVFGIYTRNPIDYRLWSSIGDQLRKKGAENQKRCAVRKRADQASKDTFIPVFFPPLPEVSPSEIENLLDLRPDETAQVHSRLVVEKYITFSQPFLNTILNGRREEAIELFLCEGESKDALRRAQECILEGLWHGISFGMDSHAIRSDPTLSRLMHFASRLDVASMNQIKAAELSMFIAISQDHASRLRELGLEFHKMGHSSAALLCLDQYFSRALQIQSMALIDAIEELDLFYIYVNLLSATVYQTDPCEDIATATLFGIQQKADNKFLVPQNTWLHMAALELRLRSATSNDFILSALELRGLFFCVLVDHIKQMIDAENNECARSKAFRPCLVFAVSGFCTQPDCPEAHVSPSVIDAGYYNMRIRLHLQQILIFQSLRENVHADTEYRGTKFWLHRLCDALHPPHHMFGSISHLALSTIPEAPKALNVVKDWVRTLIYRREFLPDMAFLTDVIRATTLAFMFDRSEADDYLKHAAYFSMRTPPMYIRRGGSSILPELLAAMSGTYTWSLTAGFVFVEHVIMRRSPINVGVLCDLVDFLCSSVIFCGRHPGMALLHDVTVPRSWLLCFIEYDLPYLNPRMQTNAYHLLLMCMEDLLEQLHGGEGSEYLLYGTSRNFSNVPAVVRHVFIARILKAICLLGYNIRNDLVQNKIRKLLLSLHQEGCMLPSLYSRYVDAASDSWDELATAIRCSLQHDTMDEMIQLLHKSKAPARGCTLPGVRQVVYDDLMDIRELLDSIPIQDMTRSESPEQIAAAILIQRVYRKVLYHRRGVSKIGTASLHARIHASCTKEVSQLGENPGLYLRLFLGPLPHVLVCLETVRIDTLSERKRTKKRLKKCSPNEIAALDDLLMQINKANRAAVNLQKQLSPSSVFHGRCDDKQLRKLVEEVNDLVSSLPFNTSSDLSNDLHLAIKGIVAEHPQAHA